MIRSKVADAYNRLDNFDFSDPSPGYLPGLYDDVKTVLDDYDRLKRQQAEFKPVRTLDLIASGVGQGCGAIIGLAIAAAALAWWLP